MLARKLGVAPENLVLGNGSNDVLELVARAFLTPRRLGGVLAPRASWSIRWSTQAIGARAIEVPARGYGTDLDALAAAVRADTKIVFVANPNNPTGTFTPWDELRDVHRARARATCWWSSTRPTASTCPPSCVARRRSGSRAFPTSSLSRTLSKAYGLAGLRVGYGVAHPDVAELMNRVRQPFNVNHLAMVAACAALDDAEFIEQSRAMNAAGLEQLAAGFERLGLEYIPSYAQLHHRARGRCGARSTSALLAGGVIVRPDRELRHARAPARHGRPARAQRALPRRARSARSRAA